MTRIDCHERNADPATAPASGTALHPSAPVLASCSGSKRYPDLHDDMARLMVDGPDDSTAIDWVRQEVDNSLKIWALQEPSQHSPKPGTEMTGESVLLQPSECL